MKSSLLASSPLLAILTWTTTLLLDDAPFQPAGVLLIGLGLLATATVATVGMVVVGGRWAHRLGFVVLAICLALAVVREIDLMWVAATAVTLVSLIALLSPTVTTGIRKLPAASGPPPRAILPPLILLVAPTALGLTGHDSPAWALMVVGLSAPVAAFLYSRVIVGGLLAIRVVWPVLAISLSPALGWLAGSVAAATAVAVAIIAWGPSVRASYHPPREVGSMFPIPPELTPKEVLDAARIDEKGRRK